MAAVIRQLQISIAGMSYAVVDDGEFFEYSMTLNTRSAGNFRALSRTLLKMDKVLEYRILPKGY